MRFTARLPLILAPILLTLACLGTATSTESPIVTESAETAIPDDTATTPTQTTEMTASQPSGLKVAFVLNGNIWFWSETTPARQLTQDGDAGEVKISSDGLVIAYRRGQALWAVNSDGLNPRLLVDTPAFVAPILPPAPEPPLLGDFQFRPGSHIIYFNTRNRLDETYGIPANDLHRVDADAPQPQTLLAAGGGDLTFSPDGSLLALARTDRINVLNADGSGLRTVFEFKVVNTYSDWSYIPQVVWLSDSTGFYTVIPASDPIGNPSQTSRFLYVSPTASFSAQLAEFPAVPVRISQPLIAPDGSKVGYVTQSEAGLEVHVIDASTADVVVASHPPVGLIKIWAWSPDSKWFAYWVSDPANINLAGINLTSTPLLESGAPYSMRWVNAEQFLYFQGGELRLGQVGKPVLTVIASGFASPQADWQAYDFTP